MSGDQRTVIKGNPSQYVKLNVGGCLYYTTIGTLTKAPDTMLQAMFSGRMEVLTDPEGWILIDRCGKHFGTILNYLRDGNVGLPTNSQELEEILAEAKFYCITGLINLCEKTLENRNTVLSPVCQVPFITSEDERKQFIANATKPVVELLINRHNNKYSYTNTSDENLLKNLEMFDRLALRFNGRIHFIKDAIGPSEICCWRFYGNGKKFAEVCCTSIVYATDRKHTKVEFPEARIYEETLNSFLYENRPGPDQELMRATSVGGVVVGVGGVTNCTSDEEEDRRHHRSSNMPKSAMTVEACVSSKTGSSETINTVSTVNSTPGSSLTQPLQIFPQHESSPNVTNMNTSTPIASKLSGPGSLDTLARDLYKVFSSTPMSRKTSLVTSPQPSTSKQGSNFPVTTPLTQQNVKPCVVSPQSSLISNQPLAVLSPVLPVTSPRMPVGSPTPPVSTPALPVSSPALPVSSPTLPVSSPTLPVSSPTLPVPSQTWLFPCPGSLLPGQASPLPSQASTLPSQASPLPSQASPLLGQASLVQSQASSLPSQVSPFPNQTSPFPNQTSSFPSQSSSFPSQTSSFPSQSSSFPNQTSSFPSQSASFPSQTSSFPSQTSSFPSQTSSFPRQASLVQSHASPVPGLPRMPMQASPVIFQKSVVPSQVTPVSSLGNPVSSQLGTPTRMSPLPSHISPVPTQAPRPPLQVTPTPSNILQIPSNLQSHGLHLPPHLLTATSQRLPVLSQPLQYQRYIVPTPQGYSVIDCSPTGMIPQSNASLASTTPSPKLL